MLYVLLSVMLNSWKQYREPLLMTGWFERLLYHNNADLIWLFYFWQRTHIQCNNFPTWPSLCLPKKYWNFVRNLLWAGPDQVAHMCNILHYKMIDFPMILVPKIRRLKLAEHYAAFCSETNMFEQMFEDRANTLCRKQNWLFPFCFSSYFFFAFFHPFFLFC